VTDLSSLYLKVRAETAEMLGYDPGNLTPEQSMRLDCAVTLRLALDDQQSRIVRGESVDVSKMMAASEALSRFLPRLAEPAPAANRIDPRQIMLETYLGMRQRGAAAGQGYDGLKLTVERLQAELANKDARIAELEAALAGSVPLPPNAVKLRNDNPNPRAPASAAPAAPPKPEPPPPAAASAPVLGDLVMVVDSSPQEEWRKFIAADGSISPTPVGGSKWWGPV
jgi:hypothetical protein